MHLNSPLSELKGVGEVLARTYARLGIKTVGELIDYYPRRYDDYSQLSATNSLQPGLVTIEAVLKQVSGRYVRRGMHITEAVASDSKGSVRLVWFNQPYRERALKIDEPYYISGDYQLRRQRFTILNPSVELKSDLPLNTARIVPIYRETKGLTSRQIRYALAQCSALIASLPERLPPWLITQEALMSYAQAMETIHFPSSAEELEKARKRLGFDEVFSLSLASLLNKQEQQQETGLEIPFSEKLARAFVSHLPFKLTPAQRRVTWQIYLDIQRPQPMNRLLEGDVGAGKTVVATMAALMAIEQGWQVAFMAPTELLARQHADTIYRLLEPLGLQTEVSLLVGGLATAQKKAAHDAIASQKTHLIVGTQALIQDKVNMQKLALVIIDEQHRFGVDQRKELQAKAGHMPHILSMTATPIPRSLALTLYGELDISVLDTKPPGRVPIMTEIIAPASRAKLYAAIDAKLESGQQLFVVCPMITDSDVLAVASAEKVFEQLSKHEFKHRRVGLLHGKLKATDKKDIMQQFVDKELDILVSTTVIEVGVDVRNASMMLIESAERFGLAQLHQLRGRVGRGSEQGYCYLLLSDSKAVPQRLRALTRINDGFKLAELDLELRGPGAIYGTVQHGQLDLRIAKLSDTKLIAAARACAQECIDRKEDLLHYKDLMTHVTQLRAVTNLN